MHPRTAALILTGGIAATEPRKGLCPTCRGKRFSHAGLLGQARRSTQTRCIVCRGTGHVRVGDTKR